MSGEKTNEAEKVEQVNCTFQLVFDRHLFNVFSLQTVGEELVQEVKVLLPLIREVAETLNGDRDRRQDQLRSQFELKIAHLEDLDRRHRQTIKELEASRAGKDRMIKALEERIGMLTAVKTAMKEEKKKMREKLNHVEEELKKLQPEPEKTKAKPTTSPCPAKEPPM